MRLAILVALALAACRASNPPPTAEEVRALADRACPRVTRPMLFQVSKDGGPTTHFLGTRHAGVPLSKFPPNVRQAFEDAPVLVVESMLDETLTPPAGKRPLSEELGEDAWERYRALVGDDIAGRMEHASPVDATVALLLLYEDRSASLDLELFKNARAANKPIVALEDQARSDELSGQILGIDFLRKSIAEVRSRDVMRQTIEKGLADYCTGAPVWGYEPDAIMTERNRAWIPKLQEVMARDRAFVAVGSHHLVGESGVLMLLRDAGYDVSQEPSEGDEATENGLTRTFHFDDMRSSVED